MASQSTEEHEVDRSKLPLVYSCSGCSSAAQMANYVAVQLDRKNLAEMSCIAGVGGGVRKLVKVAQSGRPIVGIDGCALACVKHCLENNGVQPTAYHQLQTYGVEKVFHMDFDEATAQTVMADVIKSLPGAKEAESAR